MKLYRQIMPEHKVIALQLTEDNLDEFNQAIRSNKFVVINDMPVRSDLLGGIDNLDIGDYLIINEYFTSLLRKDEFEKLFEEVDE